MDAKGDDYTFLCYEKMTADQCEQICKAAKAPYCPSIEQRGMFTKVLQVSKYPPTLQQALFSTFGVVSIGMSVLSTLYQMYVDKTHKQVTQTQHETQIREDGTSPTP